MLSFLTMYSLEIIISLAILLALAILKSLHLVWLRNGLLDNTEMLVERCNSMAGEIIGLETNLDRAKTSLEIQTKISEELNTKLDLVLSNISSDPSIKKAVKVRLMSLPEQGNK